VVLVLIQSSISFVYLGIQNFVAYGIGHQETRVAAGRDKITYFGRRYFELRDGMYMDPACSRRVQVLDPVRAMLGNQFAQGANIRRFPAGSMCLDNMGVIQDLIPSMPRG
jgi:hypothetical protein